MSSTPLSAILARRAEAKLHTRVVAFGSSNTERRLPGMHWFDLFEIAYKATHGRIFTCINAGRGGDTTVMLLDRMERDCLDFRPDITIVTVGGNDANPSRNVSFEQYTANLTRIVEKLKAAGCEPVLQTYYAPDRVNLPADYMENFDRYMEVVRTIACQTGAHLIDHLPRWEKLRDTHYSVFQGLMQDPMHVNEAGNLLLGHDLIRAFGLQLPDAPHYRESKATHALLDAICAA